MRRSFLAGVSALDWWQRLLLFGIPSLVSTLVGGALAVIGLFPWWALVLTAVAAFFVTLGLVGGTYRLVRYLRRQTHFGAGVTYFRGERIHMTDLVREIDPPVVVRKTFEDCDIVGPAVLHFKDSVSLEDIHLNMPELGAGFITVQEGQPLHGVVIMIACAFRRCTFHRIAFAGSPEFHQQVRDATTDLLTPKPAPAPAPRGMPAPPKRRGNRATPATQHNLAAIGREATCSCGRQFGTAVEFEAHRREEV